MAASFANGSGKHLSTENHKICIPLVLVNVLNYTPSNIELGFLKRELQLDSRQHKCRCRRNPRLGRFAVKNETDFFFFFGFNLYHKA